MSEGQAVLIHRLIEALETMAADCGSSAGFFADKAAALRQTQQVDKDLDDILRPLSTCRAMAQYSNFSIHQETLLDQVIDLANACLATVEPTEQDLREKRMNHHDPS